MSDIAYWLALSQLESFGAGSFKKLYNYFPNLKDAWQADIRQWEKIGISQEAIASFYLQRKQIDPEKLLLDLEKDNIQAITILDKNYPKLLKEIYNPPALLYYRGVLPTASDLCLGVVGTRKISPYGQQATAEIVTELVSNGLVIVSGLALGVDTLAHQTTLKNQGKTLAILGSGVDRASIYPGINCALADKIVESGGAVISEYPPKTQPTKFNFPARNRIISGLSLGTLVVEADEKSGALITAQFALEQNREIFAVPGSIFLSTAKGTNQLLKSGAKLTTSAQDILETLNLEQVKSFNQAKAVLPDNPEEAKLLEFLSSEAVHIDWLVKNSLLSTSIVGATLTMMEMKGKVRNLGGMNYVLVGRAYEGKG